MKLTDHRLYTITSNKVSFQLNFRPSSLIHPLYFDTRLAMSTTTS